MLETILFEKYWDKKAKKITKQTSSVHDVECLHKFGKVVYDIHRNKVALEERSRHWYTLVNRLSPNVFTNTIC